MPLVDTAPGVLPNDEVLLPTLLRDAGYATHMVGKWHLGFRTWGHTPLERGFDSHFGFFAGSTDYWKIESLCWAGPFPDGCMLPPTRGPSGVVVVVVGRGSIPVRVQGPSLLGLAVPPPHLPILDPDPAGVLP